MLAADVKAIFPELAAIDDAAVTRWMAFASARFNAKAFAGKADYALACLTAHYIELERRRAGGGGATSTTGLITARTVDGVSTTFAAPEKLSLADVVLTGTAYGQLYLDLRGSIFADRVLE